MQKLDLPGIELTAAHRRVYPRQYLASQLLGSVGTDGNGLSGIEYADDKLLQGTNGERRLVKDALGDSLSPRDTKTPKAGARHGADDRRRHPGQVERVLAERRRDLSAPRGAPRSSWTRAPARCSRWPTGRASTPTTPGAAPGYATQNRAVGLHLRAGLDVQAVHRRRRAEDGTVTPQTPFDLPPQIQVADRVIGESHARGTVTLTTAQILAQSSNVGAIKIGLAMGSDRFDYWVRRFGFGKPTGIDLPGEERGHRAARSTSTRAPRWATCRSARAWR